MSPGVRSWEFTVTLPLQVVLAACSPLLYSLLVAGPSHSTILLQGASATHLRSVVNLMNSADMSSVIQTPFSKEHALLMGGTPALWPYQGEARVGQEGVRAVLHLLTELRLTPPAQDQGGKKFEIKLERNLK